LLSDVTVKRVVKFLWKHIVCYFNLPHTNVSDNETSFASAKVSDFCSRYKIVHRFSTLYYLQGNGQDEISNCTILEDLCKSLGEAKVWVKKLLWASWTTKRIPTGETLFSMAYRTEVVISIDIYIYMPTLQTEGFDLE